MNPLQAAHLRILESLPRERIRAHYRPEPKQPRTGRPDGRLPAIRRERIVGFMKSRNPATGKPWTQRDMAAELRISRTAVQKHLRALRKGKR